MVLCTSRWPIPVYTEGAGATGARRKSVYEPSTRRIGFAPWAIQLGHTHGARSGPGMIPKEPVEEYAYGTMLNNIGRRKNASHRGLGRSLRVKPETRSAGTSTRDGPPGLLRDVISQAMPWDPPALKIPPLRPFLRHSASDTLRDIDQSSTLKGISMQPINLSVISPEPMNSSMTTLAMPTLAPNGLRRSKLAFFLSGNDSGVAE